MKICKKCGGIAKPNIYVSGYYCQDCGNLGFDEVYSQKRNYKISDTNDLHHAVLSLLFADIINSDQANILHGKIDKKNQSVN